MELYQQTEIIYNHNVGGTAFRTLMRSCLKKFKPTVALFQELGLKENGQKLKEKGFKEYKFSSDNSDTHIARMASKDPMDKVDLEKSLGGDYFEPEMRAAMIKRCHLAIVGQILFISFHGKHNRTKDSSKLEQIKELLEMARQLGKKLNVTVVIGGDFNLDFKKFSSELKDVHDYFFQKKKGGRMIDGFIVFGCHGSKISLECIDMDLIEVGYDHPPMCIKLTVKGKRSSSSVLKSSQTKPE